MKRVKDMVAEANAVIDHAPASAMEKKPEDVRKAV